MCAKENHNRVEYSKFNSSTATTTRRRRHAVSLFFRWILWDTCRNIRFQFKARQVGHNEFELFSWIDNKFSFTRETAFLGAALALVISTSTGAFGGERHAFTSRFAHVFGHETNLLLLLLLKQGREWSTGFGKGLYSLAKETMYRIHGQKEKKS